MANKNTKQLRVLVRRAGKNKNAFVEHLTPVRNYNDLDKSEFVTQRIPTAVMGTDGVNSVNKRRNSCQRIYHNVDNKQKVYSITKHEAWVKHAPMVFPNHKYIDYRRGDGTIAATTV